MRIERVRVRRYRCLKDLTLDIDDYAAFVGPNGSGKSSVLYALDWFFNGGSLSEDDFHSTPAGGSLDQDESTDIDVEVTFGDLTTEDREILGQYGRGEKARLRRIWSRLDGKEKMIGNSRQGPGFVAIKAASPMNEMRKLYKEARSHHPTLADVTTKADILEQLASWESEGANASLLEEVEASDATHMFGFDGEHTLARRMRLILVPASSVIADQVSTSGKSSAVVRLIGVLMSGAVAAARAKWESDNEEQLSRLTEEIKAGVKQSTKLQAEHVNQILADLVPKAMIDFVPETPSWSVKGDTSIRTDVVIDGKPRDVGRQGHGIQRAVMISMLQAVAPYESSANATVEDSESGEGGLAQELARLPSLVLCIEEPEIYQHPVRARHFARVLAQWSQRANSQVLFASHSPYFVLPEQFGALRRFTLAEGSTEVKAATVKDVASAAGVDTAKVEKVVEKELPRTFSEGFFADSVVFVEGDTDRVVLEVLAERLGKSLDTSGTVVLAMGSKENPKIPLRLLDCVGIPVYVMADGDADGAARNHQGDATKQAEAAGSHEAATKALLAWLPSVGSARTGNLPYHWGGETTITDRWCVLRDDLETELEMWPEYNEQLAGHGETLRSKNVAAIRSAALDAGLEGLPDTLRELIHALADFGR